MIHLRGVKISWFTEAVMRVSTLFFCFSKDASRRAVMSRPISTQHSLLLNTSGCKESYIIICFACSLSEVGADTTFTIL